MGHVILRIPGELTVPILLDPTSLTGEFIRCVLSGECLWNKTIF